MCFGLYSHSLEKALSCFNMTVHPCTEQGPQVGLSLMIIVVIINLQVIFLIIGLVDYSIKCKKNKSHHNFPQPKVMPPDVLFLVKYSHL